MWMQREKKPTVVSKTTSQQCILNNSNKHSASQSEELKAWSKEKKLKLEKVWGKFSIR
jgi:hypothetical protein